MSSPTRVTVSARECRIEGPPLLLDMVDAACSFFSPGAQYSEKFADGLWDGYIRATQRRGHNARAFPLGLLERVRIACEGFGEIRDLRWETPPKPMGDLGPWTGPDLFGYQVRAVDEALMAGGGILKMPIRSGKTWTAASLLHRLGKRAVFFAPSELLVRQTYEAFKAVLGDANITVVGGGIDDDASGDIVVTTLQTVETRKNRAGDGGKWWRAFSKAFDVLVVDELHRGCGAGREWRETALAMEVRFRFGLSGTLNVEDEEQALWSEAIAGPVVFAKGMDDMVELGRLTPADVHFLLYEAEEVEHDPSEHWSRTYKDNVVDCAGRNEAIVWAAVREARAGRAVMVDCYRMGHARALATALRAQRVKTGLLIGKKDGPPTAKWDAIDQLSDGRCQVLVTTLLGEGVDIPKLDVVINAEGGGDSHAATQRWRNLTAAAGKTKAIIYELADLHHPKLAAQTMARRELYSKHPKCFPNVGMLRAEGPK